MISCIPESSSQAVVQGVPESSRNQPNGFVGINSDGAIIGTTLITPNIGAATGTTLVLSGNLTAAVVRSHNGQSPVAGDAQIEMQWINGAFSQWIGTSNLSDNQGSIIFKTYNGTTDTYAASTTGLTISNGNVICPGNILAATMNCSGVSVAGSFSTPGASAAAAATETLIAIGGATAGFAGANDANKIVAVDFSGTSFFVNGGGIVPYVGARIAMQKVGSWNAGAGGQVRGELVFSTAFATGDALPVLTERMRITAAGNTVLTGDLTGVAATFSGATKFGIKTIATLPSAASSSGDRFQVSDSATIVNRIAFSNGSAWYYEGTAVAV